MKGMTFIKCRRKVAKVFAIFVIDYMSERIKETEEITLKTGTRVSGKSLPI